MKRKSLMLALMICLLAVMGQPTSVKANPARQVDDPVFLCTQGVLLLLSGNTELAVSSLEAGFAGREQVGAENQEAMNMCALYLGMQRYTANDSSGALEAFEYALQGVRASGDQQLEWSMLYGISAVYMSQGDYPGSLDLLGQALSLTRQAQQAQPSNETVSSWVPDTMPFFAEVATLNNLGYVYGLQGQYDEAQANFEAAEQALERYDQLVQEMGGIEAIAGGVAARDPIMADLEQMLAQFGGAIGEASLEELLLQNTFTQASETLKVALLNNRGEISRLQGGYEQAHENLGAALALLREKGDSSGSGPALPSALTTSSVNEGVVLNNIGLVYVDQKRYGEGLDHFQQARASMQTIGDVAGEVTVLDNIGSWHAIQEQYDEALVVLQDALTLAADNPLAQAPVHTNMGQVHYAQGRYAEALDRFQQALALMTAAGHQLGEAQARAKVADIHIMQGRYEEALEELEKALLIMRQKGLLSGQALMLHSIGATYQAQGRYQDALDAFQQGLEILRVLKDKKNEIGALNNIGTVYIEQGRYEDALFTLELALDLEDEVKDRDSQGITLNNVGAVYQQQGRYGEALRNFEQAKAIMEEIGSQAGKGQALNNIGSVYRATGRYDEALEQFNEALAVLRQVGNRVEEAVTLNNIGAVYLAQARYGEAFDVLQQAREIWQQLGARQKVGQSLINIGSLYQAQGRNEEALEQFGKALKILREVNHPLGEATALHNIGSIYLDQAKFGQALAQYEQALQIQRQIGEQAGEALTLSNMGVVYVYQDNYTDGMELLQDSLAIRQKIDDHAGEGHVRANIAAIYLAQGAYEEALTYYQEALAIMQEVGERVNEGIVLSQMGYVYEQQDQYDEALAYYEEAMTIYESVRAVAGSELGRIGFVTQYVGLYEQAVRLYYAQGNDEKAFLTSERGRARAFLDSLATGEVQLSDEAAADLLAQERSLYAQQQATRTALAQARALDSTDSPAPESVAALEQDLLEIEQNHAAVLAQIEALDEKLTQLIPGRTQQASLSEIQQQIDPNTTLLSYYILGNDETLAFLITRNELNVVALGVCCQDLNEQLTAFYQDFSNPFLDSVDAHKSERLQQLYQWLITPLKSHLNTPGVTIVPHGILHYLPFAALTDGERYLADDYVLFTVPSASVLPLIQQNRPRDTTIERILALGNPTFDSNLPQLEGQKLSNLPLAKQEVESLTNLFGDKVHALFGTEATESAFRAAQADILHVAAHGIYNPDNPLSSLLVLAHDTTNDGVLEVSEVYGLEFTNTNLIVLSACETSMNSGIKQEKSVVIAGDEIVALNRAFLFAGARSVISSLWGVDDTATARLMEHFYTHLQAGTGKAEALRQAQIDIREEYPHPYYWAGFILAGDSGEITSSSRIWRWFAPFWRWRWLIGAAFLLLIIIWWVVSRRRTHQPTQHERRRRPRRRY